MQRNKKEPCRNFQRGSCQYGERCKFLHVAQQQPKSNAFEQKTNPFGFGVQNKVQSKGTNGDYANNNFGNKNQFKAFDNKWTRFSPISAGGATAPRQHDNQSQLVNHKCTDPNDCKHIIAEDFEHERPLWKLTCYGHWKNSPCDIIGDISCEELRTAAYDDAKRGLSLQSIVERERNLLSSKLMEFNNLLQNPYTGPVNSALAIQSPFLAATTNAFSLSSTSPSVSTFSHLGSSVNTDSRIRPSSPSNYTIGQPNSSQTTSPFGPIDSQIPLAQGIRTPLTPGMTSFSINGVVSAGSIKISTPEFAIHNSSFSIPSGGPVSTLTVAEQATTNIQMVKNSLSDTITVGTNVWLKERWIPGEIPEEAPPDTFV